MPFKSEAQRRYLYAKEPAVAAEFEAKTPNSANLPKKVKRKEKSLKHKMTATTRGR